MYMRGHEGARPVSAEDLAELGEDFGEESFLDSVEDENVAYEVPISKNLRRADLDRFLHALDRADAALIEHELPRILDLLSSTYNVSLARELLQHLMTLQPQTLDRYFTHTSSAVQKIITLLRNNDISNAVVHYVFYIFQQIMAYNIQNQSHSIKLSLLN